MPEYLRRALDWHRPLMVATAAMIVTAVVATVGYMVDGRILVGVPIWAKPLKFSISFAVYAATLAWLVDRLRQPRAQRIAHRVGTAIAVAIVIEMGAIVLQVARGTQSHFNFSTGFNSAVFAVMGVSVLVIFLATVGVGIALLRDAPALARTTTLAVRLGLAISLAGMAVGFLMVVPRPGQGDDAPIRGAHSIGSTDGGPTLPLLGWDTTGGDLRIPHFIGLHALQAVPLLAAILTLLPVTARLHERTLATLIKIGGGFVAGLFVLTLWQACRGQPITSPDTWTILALAAIVVATSVAVVLTVRSDRDVATTRRRVG